MIGIEIYKKHLKKYLFLIVSALLCVSGEAVCDLLQPTVMSKIIDNGVKNGSVDIVIRYGLTMLLISLIGMGFAATRNVLAAFVSQSFGADLRLEAFAKVLRLDESSTDSLDSGSIITRLTNDTSQVVMFVNGMMRIFFKAPLTCIGAIVLAVTLSPRLSIITLASVAVVFVIITISMKLSYRRFTKVQYAIDRINTIVQEYLSGVRLVKAFGRFDKEEAAFEVANDDLAKKSVRSQLVITYLGPLMSLAINLSILTIFYLGSLLFNKGDIEVGKIAAFVSYMSQILGSLIMITNIFNTFVRTKASATRLNQVFSGAVEREGQGDVVGADYKKSDNERAETDSVIEFDNVTFAYPGGSGLPALTELSFTLSKGQTLAIIGPTGSGKSTIAWLLLRFYELNHGNIYYNKKDINSLSLSSLRDSIAIAPQKPMLFSGTILDNILWGKAKSSQTVPMDEVKSAATTACASEFIGGMHDGYDTLLGQGGVNLSGGQKQRISIARAVVKQSPVLILDDCTSALDAITEGRVKANLRSQESTVILITQRIGSALTADKILVMDNGRRVGFGNHEVLLTECETYRDIYNSQIGGDL